MNNPNSWMRLKSVAEQRRDESARCLVRASTELKNAQQKLQLLLDYRLDYQTRLDRASRMGIRGEGLVNYQRFLANLERAVEQQTAVLAGLKHGVAKAQQKVNVDHRRTESYQVLGDRRTEAADVQDRRRQQAQQDEMATRARLKLVHNAD
jgi:flagellar protein FliJ